MRGSRAVRGTASALVLLVLLAAGCADLGTDPEPRETGSARIDFVTYPGEVEPGNVALFTLLGGLPTPCHEITDAEAVLDDGRVELSATWVRRGEEACPAVIEPFETTARLEAPAGFDRLEVAVADSVWDRIEVRVEAPGFKKAAGELAGVEEVDGAPGCHRARAGLSDRRVLLEEPPGPASPFVVGRLESRVPEACAGTDLEGVLGTLVVESAR